MLYSHQIKVRQHGTGKLNMYCCVTTQRQHCISKNHMQCCADICAIYMWQHFGVKLHAQDCATSYGQYLMGKHPFLDKSGRIKKKQKASKTLWTLQLSFCSTSRMPFLKVISAFWSVYDFLLVNFLLITFQKLFKVVWHFMSKFPRQHWTKT